MSKSQKFKVLKMKYWHLWTFDPGRNLCRFHWQKTRQPAVAVLTDFVTGKSKSDSDYENTRNSCDFGSLIALQKQLFSPIFAGEELLVGGDGKAEWTLDHAPGFDHQQSALRNQKSAPLTFSFDDINHRPCEPHFGPTNKVLVYTNTALPPTLLMLNNNTTTKIAHGIEQKHY